MIIVSQDRCCITDDMNLYIKERNPSVEIKKYAIENNNFILGIYETEERAKEVLQEIICAYKFNKCEAVGQKNAVYEMPED